MNVNLSQVFSDFNWWSDDTLVLAKKSGCIRYYCLSNPSKEFFERSPEYSKLILLSPTHRDQFFILEWNAMTNNVMINPAKPEVRTIVLD